MAKESYDHQAIEKAVQEKWVASDLYTIDLTDTSKEPYYLLTEFPYPSGDLHIGHWYAFSLPDIFARYKRMQGKNVLFPFGFDAFGLPAENAAIKNGLDPRKWTYANMDRMRTQIRSMGGSFDWSKEVVTCDPEYYKWTQWLFSKLFEHGLAERKEAAVKWCPHDLTVLANEQVIDGHCDRCGAEVEEKVLTQWFLKITQYADRLLKDLDPLPWREEIKEAQRAWIGESEGAKIYFDLRSATNDDAGALEVFTTRPDTVFGASYVVLAPEHPLVETLLPLTLNPAAVEAYRAATGRKTERERSENKEKTGVPLEGIFATNPANNVEVPVYIADYVLASYGTGAVMAVPAHDERDYEFARKYALPITPVIEPLFVARANSDAVREELPYVEREAITAIVKHWSEDKYMILAWKDVAWHTFITGGVEPGQTPVEAAIAEIREETGYKHPKLVRELGTFHSKFYHVPKGENRFGHFHSFYFELEDDAQEVITGAEKAKHDLAWLSPKEFEKLLTADAHKHLWANFKKPSPYTGDGILVNSGTFTGRDNREALWEIAEASGGERVTNYRLRDWLVSRQRYWGCPIPIVYDPDGVAHSVPAEYLPWTLPTDVDFSTVKDSGGKSPIATSVELRERVERIFGKGWTPECDTLDTFVDSSWYFTRYLDPQNSSAFSDPKLMKN